MVRRAGLDARIVALLHWAFAGIGGATAIAFLAVPSLWKLPVVLVPVLVQLVWTAYVVRRASAANLGRW